MCLVCILRPGAHERLLLVDLCVSFPASCSYPRSYVREMRDAMHYYMNVFVSTGTIQSLLKRLNFTHKKRVKAAAEKYTPLNLMLDRVFRLWRSTLDPAKVVVIDEVCMKDTKVARLYSYALANERYIDIDKKSDGPSVMFIAAMTLARVLPITLPVPSPHTVTGGHSSCLLEHMIAMAAMQGWLPCMHERNRC